MALLVVPKLEMNTEDNHRGTGSVVNVSKSIATRHTSSRALKAWRHRGTSKRVDDGMRRAILARMHEDIAR